MAVITRTNEAQGKSCCDIVKVDSSDTMASYLANKLTEGDYVIFTTKDGVEGKTIEISLNAAALSGAVASPNDKVKAHSADPNAAGYLYDKLTTNPSGTIIVKKNGTNSLVYFDIELDVTELNDVVSSGLGNGGILVYDDALSKWVCVYAIEDTFSGTATKVPLSSAIKELLKALYITNATDCGSGGDSIMQKTQHIPASSITVMEKEGTNLIFSGGYPALSPAVLDDNKWDTTAGCRSFGGMVKIKSINGGSAEAETSSFVIAVIPFGINEDAVGTNFWVDVLFYCPATGERDETTVVGALPFIFVGDGTDQPTPGPVVEKTIKYDDEVGKVVYKTFEFARGDTSTTASGGIIIMVNITDSNNFDAQILSARVRYETKTINLRKADVYEEV
jgi:hypothetical protein